MPKFRIVLLLAAGLLPAIAAGSVLTAGPVAAIGYRYAGAL